MNTYETICSRRTIREFEAKKISTNLLEKYANAGRLAPQAANRQPLEFIIVDDEKLTEEFFRLTKLAGYIDWEPSFERRAPAYIVLLGNKEIQKTRWMSWDAALAAENIALAAWEDGIGSCMIGAFNKEKVTNLLGVPATHEVLLLIALGHPAHKSVVEEAKGNNIKYWRDENGTFHVPKKPLSKIMHKNRFRKQ